MPYWAGYDSLHSTPDTTKLPHAPPRFWKQAVAVDPTGKLQPGDSVFLPFNKQPATWLKIVPLSQFYHVTVSAADSVNLTQFGSLNGDDLGFGSDTTPNGVLAAARPGNIGLMMAMHVTGKEIANGTWQSYWWSPNQNDSLGTDRPATIKAPWNNYVMTTAYSMLTTANQPNVAFNPYLETSLAGNTGGDAVEWRDDRLHELPSSRGGRLLARAWAGHSECGNSDLRSRCAGQSRRLVDLRGSRLIEQAYADAEDRLPLVRHAEGWRVSGHSCGHRCEDFSEGEGRGRGKKKGGAKAMIP